MKTTTLFLSSWMMASFLGGCADDATETTAGPSGSGAGTAQGGAGQGGAAQGGAAQGGAGQGGAGEGGGAQGGSGGGGTSCGDGTVDADETCDDGNTESFDGCSSSCEPEELSWEQISADGPTVINGSLVDDGNDLLVFLTLANNTNQTWRRTSSDWLNLATPTVASPGYNYPSMQHDASNGLTVMFMKNQTWEHDGTSWSLQGSGPANVDRLRAGMVYDSLRDRMVLFGGISGATYLNDTWVYQNGDWSQVNTSTTPAARLNHAMVYDSERDVVVMFGGCHENACLLSATAGLTDTWEFNGTNWAKVTTASAPTVAQFQRAAYDPVRKVMVLVNRSTGTTFEYDDSGYSALPMSAAVQDAAAATYSPTHHGVVVAGSNGYWVLGYR